MNFKAVFKYGVSQMIFTNAAFTSAIIALGFTQEQVECVCEVLEQSENIERLGRWGIFFMNFNGVFKYAVFTNGISTNAASTSAIIAPLGFTQEQVAFLYEVLEQSGNTYW